MGEDAFNDHISKLYITYQKAVRWKENKHKKGGTEEEGFGILNKQYLIKSLYEVELTARCQPEEPSRKEQPQKECVLSAQGTVREPV